MSYGDSASELIKELSRAVDSLPNYDDVAVREVVEECINLEAKNREAYNSEELSRLIAGAEDQTSILGLFCFQTGLTLALEKNVTLYFEIDFELTELLKNFRRSYE